MTIPKHIKPPRNVPMHEMTAILGGRKQGMTHKAIKTYIDQGRKMRGTYRGQGISTNTISRLLGATHKVKFKRSIETAWYKYDKKTRQLGMFERTREQIVASGDKGSLARFDKMTTEVLQRQKGRQYDLETQYDAETDEYVLESG